MQNTTDLKKKEKQLTHVAFITFIWALLYFSVPIIIISSNNDVKIESLIISMLFTQIMETNFASLLALIWIIIPLFSLLISLLKINAFTKRKILDIPFFVFGLYTIAGAFISIYSITHLGEVTFLGKVEEFPLNPLLCLLYIPVFIAYLSIRRAFVKKKKASKGKKATLPDSQKKSTKKSSNKEENAPFIHITYV